MRNRNTLRQWLLSLKAWLLALADGLFELPTRLSCLVQRLRGQLHPDRPPFAHGGTSRRVSGAGALLRRWPADHAFARRGAGLVMPAAIMAALLVIGGVAVMAARSLSSWTRAVSNADLRAAREAAEYGFSEIVGQLNTDANAYLWVTKSASWQTLTQSDLDACAVIATTAPSANRIAGVNSNSSNQRQTLPNNSALSYSLTGFTEPSFPPGQANFYASGDTRNACTTATAAAKFGNLKGGSATLEVTGRVTRGGSQIASYKLTRMVHVKWPNDSLANPMLFLGTGSRLNYLDGNLCTTTNTAATSCTGLPRTVIGCLDLEDCLVNNVDIPNKTRDKYCETKGKKYKKGVLCNSFQQAADTLPVPPVASDYGDSRTTTSGGWLYPPDINCKQKKADKYFTKISEYESKCEVTTYNQTNGSVVGTTSGVRFDFAPYAWKNGGSPPSSSSTLTATLVPGCRYNNPSNTPTGATAITCVYRSVKTASDEMYWITAYSSAVKKKSTITTPALPVNIFVRDQGTTTEPALNLADGGIINNSISNWANLRIFGRSGAFLANGTPDCDSQKATASSKRGIGVDGAFIWLPNSTIVYNSASASSAAYTVMWVCKFTGPTSGTASKFWIINPLSRRGINSGLKTSLSGYGGNVNATTYRAYGVSSER